MYSRRWLDYTSIVCCGVCDICVFIVFVGAFMMNVDIVDMALLRQAKQAMLCGMYDKAIELTNLMQCKPIAIKAHLLIIEHEQATKEAKS